MNSTIIAYLVVVLYAALVLAFPIAQLIIHRKMVVMGLALALIMCVSPTRKRTKR